MPLKYTKVQTQDDTDTSSSGSHSRNSSIGVTDSVMDPNIAKNSDSTTGDAAVPASNIPPTYSSQQLIGSSQDSDSIITNENPDGSRVQGVEATTSGWSIPKRDIFTVAVLCFINLINYMDRYTIAGVLSELQSDFGINDSLGGLLQTAFILSYMIFAPIFGYLGDRYSRNVIMGFGIALWSATTLIGSFMSTYVGFVLLRAMVGIGEASYSTIAPTIISDLFVKDLRSKFLALFYFAIPVGSGLGYIVGSETANALGSWRWALRVTPVLGAIAVALLFLCKEPERGQSEGTHNLGATSYTEDLKALVRNPSFMLSTGGFTCVAFVAGALAWWGPKYMLLGLKSQPGNENMTLNEVSFKFGLVTMISGIIGVPLGSYLSTTYIKRFPRCDPMICAFGLLLSAPLMTGAMLLVTANTTATFVLIFFAELTLNLNWAIVADMLLYVVIPTRRSTAEAFQILISHAFGDAGSPYLVGVISDAIKASLRTVAGGVTVGLTVLSQVKEGFLTSDSMLNQTSPLTFAEETEKIQFKALQYSLFSTCFVEIIGGIFFLITAHYILRDKAKAEKYVKENQQIQENTSQSLGDSTNSTLYLGD